MAARELSGLHTRWMAAIRKKRIDAPAMALAGLLALAFPAAAQQIPNMGSPMVPNATGGGGGSSGTVTSVSVTTANGVSGVVANPTTTPAITLTLGAVTPTTVTIGAGAAITSSGAGGALGTNAFTSTAYAPLASPTFTGAVTLPASVVIGAGSAITSSGVGGALGTNAFNSTAFSTFPPAGCSTANGVVFNNATPCDNGLVYVGASGSVSFGTDIFLNHDAAGILGVSRGAADTGTVTSPASLRIFNSASSSLANYERGVFGWTDVANTLYIGSQAAGTGTVRTVTIGANAVSGAMSGAVWSMNANGSATLVIQGAGAQISMAASGVVTFGGQPVVPSLSIASNAFLTAPASATTQHGAADAASPVAQTIGVQNVVAGTSNTAGADWKFNASKSTGTGVGGKWIVQTTVTGTTGTTVNSNFPMLTLNPGSATTSTVQFGDGTNITTYDGCTALTTGATGIVACTVSAMRFKDVYSSRPLNLAGLSDLRTDLPWKYRDDAGYGLDTTRVHVGLFADDVEKMDPRCVVYRSDGLGDYEDRCLIAYLVADRRQLRHDNDNLQARIEVLERRSIAR